MVLGLTTFHQVLNIFLPEDLSHSLLVNATGRWIWQAVTTEPLDFLVILGQETVTWSLTQREFFYFFDYRENHQCSLFTSSPLSPQYVKRPLGQVGVFLDYDGGVVSL